MLELTSLYYEGNIAEIMSPVISAFNTQGLTITYYTDNKNLSEFNSTDYIVFRPLSEEIQPSKLNAIKYDGYYVDICAVRNIKVQASIQYDSKVKCEIIANALIAAIYTHNKISNISLNWVTQQDDTVNYQAELLVLEFDMQLPIPKQISRIIIPTDITFNQLIIDPPEVEQTKYNEQRKVPPEFDLV